jgi:hypothetical protein
MIGAIGATAVGSALLAGGARTRRDLFLHSDAPFFLAVARHPFGRGTNFGGDPRVGGVAYRYGRIGYPLAGWILALGHRAWIPTTLTLVLIAGFGAWIAFAAEHLRRGGRSPLLGVCVLGTPFAFFWFALPIGISEPIAGALVLLAYLYERGERRGAARVVAAIAIITRELMIVAFLPLAWRAWKERGWAGIRDWALVCAPYAAWSVWVRVRIGQFPFLDSASSRRDALSLPFVGWVRTLNGPLDKGQDFAVLIATLTLLTAVLIAARGDWQYPVTHGALALTAVVACFGFGVFALPGEALRVMAPVQVLLLIAACAPLQVARAEEPVLFRSG